MTKKEISKYLSTIGTRGGSVKSKSKAIAARRNGQKGGRPSNRDIAFDAWKAAAAVYDTHRANPDFQASPDDIKSAFLAYWKAKARE